jgi:hypothetical protein
MECYSSLAEFGIPGIRHLAGNVYYWAAIESCRQGQVVWSRTSSVVKDK